MMDNTELEKLIVWCNRGWIGQYAIIPRLVEKLIKEYNSLKMDFLPKKESFVRNNSQMSDKPLYDVWVLGEINTLNLTIEQAVERKIDIVKSIEIKPVSPKYRLDKEKLECLARFF